MERLIGESECHRLTGRPIHMKPEKRNEAAVVDSTADLNDRSSLQVSTAKQFQFTSTINNPSKQRTRNTPSFKHPQSHIALGVQLGSCLTAGEFHREATQPFLSNQQRKGRIAVPENTWGPSL